MGNRNMTVNQILEDPATSYWLRDALSTSLPRDPVDVLNDLEILRRVHAARHAVLFDQK